MCGFSGSYWCWHPSSFYMVFCAAEVTPRGGSATIVLGCWYAPVCRRYLGKWPVLLKKLAKGRLGISPCLVAWCCPCLRFIVPMVLPRAWICFIHRAGCGGRWVFWVWPCLAYAWLKVFAPSRLVIFSGSFLGLFLVPVSALDGHQKLVVSAAMTFPELTLRSASGGCACGPRLLLCVVQPTNQPELEDALIQARYGQPDASGDLPGSIPLTRTQSISVVDPVMASFRLHIGDSGTIYHVDDC